MAAIAAFALLPMGVTADEAVNDICPVKGKEVDGSKAVDYTVEFCCEKCVAKFEEEPLKYADKVASAEEGKCPMSGKDVDPDATATVHIAVCCGGCKKKVTADPGKYFGELGES